MRSRPLIGRVVGIAGCLWLAYGTFAMAIPEPSNLVYVTHASAHVVVNLIVAVIGGAPAVGGFAVEAVPFGRDSHLPRGRGHHG